MQTALIGMLSAVVLLFQLSGHQNTVSNLENRIDYLESELTEAEIKLEAYRDGIIEGQIN